MMQNIDWERFGPMLTQAAGETLYMVGIAVVVGGFFGLLIGLGLYLTRPGNLLENRLVYTLLNVAINIVRPLPFLIFVVALGPVTRLVVNRIIGIEAFTFAMCVVAAFASARLVEQNLVSIDPGVVEAARAMGASPWRIVRTVLVREALSPLILGYTFLVVGVVDMSALGGFLGAGGLGDLAIVHGYRQFNWSITYVVVAVIVIGVQLVQMVGNWLSRRIAGR
ncbi:MAG: ABC transporter permease subunit [Promicromonosporaceae bacterium]|nr:ABC transporter permease subunit [Promicromonosporaceae bacterium]